MKCIYFMPLFALGLTISGCGRGATNTPPDVPHEIVIMDAEVNPDNTPTIMDKSDSQSPTDLSVEEPSIDVYLSYMLTTYSDQTAIFSPESLKTAFYLYSRLLTQESRKPFEDFLGNRDYIAYSDSDSFVSVNRIWYNNALDINIDKSDYPRLSEFAEGLDMSSADATDYKNKFVADTTHNFITSTPTVFNANTVMDLMNIIYFKDAWLDDMHVLDDPFTFTDSEGNTSEVTAFMTNGHGAESSTTATAYTMDYADGFTCTLVLPNEGFTIDNVSLNDFIAGNTEHMDVDVHVEVPEFETASTYGINLGTFGLQDGELNPDIYSGTMPPAYISQIAKIKFDHEGTEAAAVTEMMLLASAAVEEPTQSIDLIFDKPFLYYITDTLNDDIAFIGVYNG